MVFMAVGYTLPMLKVGPNNSVPTGIQANKRTAIYLKEKGLE